MISRPAGAGATSLRKPRLPQTLNQLLNKRLLTYATMTGACAAGWASHAEAQIVYTPVDANVDFSYANRRGRRRRACNCFCKLGQPGSAGAGPPELNLLLQAGGARVKLNN